MALWQNVLDHATEELNALTQRKLQNPLSLAIDNQILEVKKRISEAKAKISNYFH